MCLTEKCDRSKKL